ncbi:hypothetical protein NL676_008109 [Syzygium grande]|nr:hypothetical protein NL676_008109 [Syzygium grande]
MMENHDLGASSRSGGPLPRTVHRNVLLEVLAKELPPNSIRFSSNKTSVETQVEQGSPVCIVTLDNGSTIKSKAVIGCDGVNSVMTRWLGVRPPVFSGPSAAPGLSVFPEGHGFEPGVIQQFVDVGKRAGFVPLNDKEVYWLCGVMGPRKASPIKHHDGWRRYAPNDLDLGQGGCSALEDVVVLGRQFGDLIAKHGELVTRDIRVAIEKYVKERRLRVTTLIAASFTAGWLQTNGSNRLMKLLRDVVFYKLLPNLVSSATRYDCGKLPSVSFMPSCGSASST